MASNATALVPIEQSQVAVAIDASSTALLELLPDPAAATRFKRVVIQALSKNPDLLACTPDSVVSAVFEAAAQGLEPTGAAGGAHLVPYNVNTGTRDNPRWEKRAQLIPDYRGIVRMVTRPDPRTGLPSEVVSIEARAVKEGDEFAYELGTNAWVRHVPSLDAQRSAKPTTHVYAVAHLRSGPPKPDVEDRAGIEKIRTRGKKKEFSPWDTDWDEMAKKTIVKRLAKLLPVTPEVRSILVREDEAEDEPAAVVATVRGPRTAQLAARLRPHPEPTPEPEQPEADLFEPAPPEPEDRSAGSEDVAIVAKIRDLAQRSGLAGGATPPQQVRLKAAFAGVPTETVQRGIRAVFDHERFASAAEAQAVITAADSLGDDAFRQEWTSLASSVSQ